MLKIVGESIVPTACFTEKAMREAEQYRMEKDGGKAI